MSAPASFFAIQVPPTIGPSGGQGLIAYVGGKSLPGSRTAKFSLSTNSSRVRVPSQVDITLPRGTFPIQLASGARGPVKIMMKDPHGITQTVSFTAIPCLSSLSLGKDNRMAAGQRRAARISLAVPLATSLSVQVRSLNELLFRVPSTVSIPAGATFADFTIEARSVATGPHGESGTIQASAAGETLAIVVLRVP